MQRCLSFPTKITQLQGIESGQTQNLLPGRFPHQATRSSLQRSPSISYFPTKTSATPQHVLSYLITPLLVSLIPLNKEISGGYSFAYLLCFCF